MTDSVKLSGAYYRSFGWQPLPMRVADRHPPIRYAELWEYPLKAHHFDRLVDREASRYGEEGVGVQLMCGAFWGLAVLDLDGPAAIEAWRSWSMFRPSPATWAVGSFEADGSPRGVHLYYTLPPGCGPVPSRLLWGVWDESLRGGKGWWAKRSAIELKADNSLIIAPPTVHSRPGCSYRILSGFGATPPAEMPGWIMALPRCEAPRAVLPLVRRPEPALTPLVPRWAHYAASDVLEAIPDKVALARSWGVRVASSRPSSSGWHDCHAIGREDRHPSAGLSVTGRYWEPDYGRLPISLFDVAVATGAYGSFPEAVDGLGQIYCPRKSTERRHARVG